MSISPDSAQDPAASLAVALAESSAAAASAAAQAGYGLTQEALQESSAAAVFPLLLLELTAIAAGLAAYTATATQWQAAEERARLGQQQGSDFWKGTS